MSIPGIEPSPGELLCVVGPTATGKTQLAIRLCEQLGGEVINADSVQIYEHFDVGSGKPTAQELSRAQHHLVGVQDPRVPLDAARFASMADEAIGRVRARGRVPVVCGGTFLWVRALVFGLAQAPKTAPEVRSRLRQEAERSGVEALHARLAAVDPATALRLGPRDLVRIERALEVWELTGRPLSQLHAEHQQRPPRHAARFVSVKWPRELVDRRIEERASGWLAGGWIEEVVRLLAMGLRDTRPMASVGYRQVLEHVEGKLGAAELPGAIVRATRVFARRQRTWLREIPTCWIDPIWLR